MRKLRAIVIGAGDRGINYSKEMKKLGEKFEIVAVAEPIDSRRNFIKSLYNIPDDRCFVDFNPLFALGKIADFAIIATMDRDHFDSAIKAIELGYDLLLEKPIAPTAEECIKITKAATKKGVKVIICTVLRYTDLFRTIKSIITSGKIGEVMSVNHEECVGNVHQTHSFVRGNWGNSEKSSCMLLQKSCHDIDILQWLLGKKCKSIQSFGTLSHFKRKNAPVGSPDYCVQGCPVGDTCPYNSIKIYFDDKTNDWLRGTATKKYNPTDEDVMHAITETQYGKCVYKCDNNVVDHQTVNMLFDDDITVTFTMNAFNEGGRFLHIMGTKGEIHAALAGEQPITVYSFETKETETIPFTGHDGVIGGHGGGDAGIISDLYDYFTGDYKGISVPTLDESLYNHLLVFAAEKSRETNSVVNVEEYLKTLF
jgi:predicted dehydrogenase